MKKCLSSLGFIALFLLLSSCDNSDKEVIDDNKLVSELELLLIEKSPNGSLEFFELPDSKDFDKIPQDPLNPLNESKVELGKLLFHDPGILINPKKAIGLKTGSCATCHFADAGFSGGIKQAIGEGGVGFHDRKVQDDYENDSIDAIPLKSPTIINNAYYRNVLWNGSMGAHANNEGTQNLWGPATPFVVNEFGLEGLETQALAALKTHRMGVDTTLFYSTEYKDLFEKAFPEITDPIHLYTSLSMAKAIAAYERVVLSNEAPFQQFLKGDKSALSDEEVKGALIFFGKGKCAECHTGPLLAANEFHAIGLNDFNENEVVFIHTDPNINPDVASLGRGGFTKRVEDFYKFKTPQLYNLTDFKFYGHGSSFTSVKDIIEYKNLAIPENPYVEQEYLSPLFAPLNLNQEEIEDLVLFLENSLYDPDLKRYEPEYVPSQLCFPNNDPQSRIDLNCGG